jgi:hypothetical protein
MKNRWHHAGFLFLMFFDPEDEGIEEKTLHNHRCENLKFCNISDKFIFSAHVAKLNNGRAVLHGPCKDKATYT